MSYVLSKIYFKSRDMDLPPALDEAPRRARLTKTHEALLLAPLVLGKLCVNDAAVSVFGSQAAEKQDFRN